MAILAETLVRRGSKIDNLVQVAHNCAIGEGVILVAQVGISGSCKIGNRAVLAGKEGVVDHVSIGERAVLTAQSGVPNDVPGTRSGAASRAGRWRRGGGFRRPRHSSPSSFAGCGRWRSGCGSSKDRTVAEASDIHPTALVDSRAELGAGVRIGPYSVIGAEVRIGRVAEIGAHVVIEGRVKLGARCRVGHGAVIGGVPQDFKYRDGLPVGVEVGDDTVIREYVTIHRATHEGRDTRIGQRCLVMVSSHVAHDCLVGDEVIIINYAGLTGHVTVEDRATIGGLVGIHPFTRIGTYAYVGGCSKVTQDVPPFVIADGTPATARAVNVIGMRRGGVDGEARRQIRAAFRILYRSGLAPTAAVARLKAELGHHPMVAQFVEFVEASKRGIISGPRDHDAAHEETEIEERVW